MDSNYYHSKTSVDEYIQMAKDVSGAELIEKLKQFLASNSLVLELGSCPGTDWKLLKEDFNVTGSDYSNEFLHRLKKNHPNDEFLMLDAATLLTECMYDAIYSNKVLLHLNDKELIDSINRQNQILNPGGIICHSFWYGEGTEIFNGLFVNYQNESILQTSFEKHFDILLVEKYMEFDDGDSLLLLARKK